MPSRFHGTEERGRFSAHGLTGVLALAFVVLLVLFYQREKPAERVFSANGYTHAVETHLLEYLRYNSDPGPDERIVELTEAGVNSDVIWKFYKNSYLQADIAANDPKLWKIGNNEVRGVDSNAHNVLLPIRSADHWHGAITFSSENRPSGELIGGDVASQSIVIEPASHFGLDNSRMRQVPASNLAWNGARRGEIIGLTDSNGQILAEVFLIGNQIVIQRTDRGENSVRVDGDELDALEYRTIPAGAELYFENPAGTSAIFTSRGVRGSDNTLSAYKSLIGRSFDKRLKDFSTSLVGDMDKLISAQEAGRSGADAVSRKLIGLDIGVTLDPELSSSIQATLETAMARVGGDDEPLPASITVMDALTGEIRVIASTPTGVDQDENVVASLRMNQNFVNHPIGSVAKPLIAAAIVDTWPSLANLNVRNTSELDEDGKLVLRNVAGLELDDPINPGGNAAEWVDYRTFLKTSSNSYAATLMVLAMGTDPEAGEHGAPSVVRNFVFRDAVPPPDYRQIPAPYPSRYFDIQGRYAINIAAALQWPQELSDLYGIDVEERQFSGTLTTGNDPRWQKSVWGPLLKDLDKSDPSLLDNQQGLLRSLSPERVNLSLNSSSDVRNDLISMILGGGQSRWNSIKVAESYARLVTGQPVNATFIQEAASEKADKKVVKVSSADCSTPIDPQVGRQHDGIFCETTRRVTMDGLYAVANEIGGTASALRPQAIANTRAVAGAERYVCVFAKTGTPDIPETYQRKIDRAVTALGDANGQYLRVAEQVGLDGRTIRQVNVQLSGDGGVIRFDAPNYVATVTASLKGDENIMRHLEYNKVSPEELAAHLYRFNNATSAQRRREILDVSSNRVRGRSIRIASGPPRYGKGLAYVIAAYEKAGSVFTDDEFCRKRAYDALPEKAFAVAINVPVALPEKSPIATVLGADVMEQISKRYLKP